MESVKERYSAAAFEREEALCCPVDYDPKYLKIIPQEVLDRDYGCGDPSTYVRSGETVLDLGAGGGKICFIAAQIVGPEGKVIGVDVNDDMLELSRSALPTVAEQLGYDNIEFRHGRIQDLKTDMDALDHWLSARPAKSAADYKDLEAHLAKSRQTHPLIADNSIDVVVSNCVLNLVSDDEKPQLFQEIFRVLKPGGRIAISDIVSDKDSPEHLKDDPDLWSGCISGALTEKGFADALSQAGFSGVQLDKLEQTPWQVVEEIEYRSATYVAHKPLDMVANDEEIEVIYAGPWEQVRDETGLTYERGARSKVSGAEASRLRSGAYAGHFVIFGEEDTDNSCC
ncbi:MAG: methyltransferase domain-containing protein [Parvibaculaceae bacterium]|nr:methyltransferase domain-containing protein [Parvibaculaceae bacterium]HBM87341.1 methyltransferase domain-containing protein [Rhodobiaceae bacterium]|tara:strand:+ start:716 stop:1738 length:1023 start_codon:yes stop_codon:yes gene_type:complete